MLLITSRTHNSAYKSLISLQLLLHLSILTLYGKHKGSLLLIFIIYILTLHSLLLIQTHLNGVTLNVIPLKNDIATTNTLLISPNIFISHYSFFIKYF